MRSHHGRVLALALVVALAGCTASPSGTETTASVESTVVPPAWTAPTEPAGAFPTEAFADIREDPVTEESAAEFQAALNEMAGGGGMTATRFMRLLEVLGERGGDV